MKVKTKLLRNYLKRKGMSNDELARAMGVSVAEVIKMLEGKAVGVNTARHFIRYFTADEAQRLIDWEAIGKENPLACDADKEIPGDEENCFDGEDDLDEDDLDGLLDEDNRYNDGLGGEDGDE